MVNCLSIFPHFLYLFEGFLLNFIFFFEKIARDSSCSIFAAVLVNQGNLLRNNRTSPWMMPETDPKTSVTIEMMDVFIAGDAYTTVRNVASQIINEKLLVV